MEPSPDLYELLIRSVVDYAIFMLDADGRVMSWNPGAERIKGYCAAEIIGQHFSCFYTEEDRAAGVPWQALRTAAETGRFTAEAWRVRKDGSRFWAMVVIDPIRRGGELVGFAKITRDMTEQHDMQLQLEQSRAQLFQAQKMEAVGQLTGGLAHDFNNLLTGIAGSLELLRMRIAQGRLNELERYITGALGATARAAALTHRLLAFARRQTLDPKPTHVNKLVAAMEDLVQRTIGPGIRLETVLGAGVWPTLCDPNQLESALLNLCINARDAMPDGGRLTIETANARVDARHAREWDMEPGEYALVSVTDTGTGMPPDVLARAFDPFYTTKPTGQGTGLGLSMVYGFAKQSEGQVQLVSEPAQGTTVLLYLPRYRGEVADEDEPVGSSIVARAEAGETVLVVDDEPTVRMLMTDVLEDLGYAVIEAADAASGLKVLQSNVRIDLLITDVGLPGGLNGRQMADAGRERRPKLKVLFVTGYAEAAALSGGRLLPGMYVLSKPFTLEMLAAKVKDVIEHA